MPETHHTAGFGDTVVAERRKGAFTKTQRPGATTSGSLLPSAVGPRELKWAVTMWSDARHKSPAAGAPRTSPISVAIRSCVGVFAAPTVSAPMPVPGLPPVIAAGPLFPAETHGNDSRLEHFLGQRVHQVAPRFERCSTQAHG